jgi:AcrR family transcriptional regulator
VDTVHKSLSAWVEETMAHRVGRFDAEGRRARILACAAYLAARDGVHGISVGAVARLAGVSTATLYRDFEDRRALIASTIMVVVPILAINMVTAAQVDDPRERLVAILRAHASTFADPFLGALLRVHAAEETEGGRERLLEARAGRKVVEDFWNGQLDRLEEAGLTRKLDRPAAINLILGPIERRTVLARLLFGEDDVAEPDIERTIATTVDTFLAWAAPSGPDIAGVTGPPRPGKRVHETAG